MNFEIYKSSSTNEIKELFTSVFTNSEGQAEGNLIGNLVFELQETTKLKDIFGFVVMDSEKIIGCIFFTRMEFEAHINAFILSPVAVATEYQNQGIGQKLINFGISYLKNNKVELLFTYGDPNFYAKVGFICISESIVKAPLKLTYPEGWLAQSLISENIEPISGKPKCVHALNNQQYW
jgi:predicted N-acetyltransferase YhbS